MKKQAHEAPRLFIRLGTHAEKEYVEKTISFLDGLVLGANLFEATPGATASLIVKFHGSAKGTPVIVDPMTYAYGSYIDQDGDHRTDLDWIMSDQNLKKADAVKQGKTHVRAFKRSYLALAQAFGGVFADAVDKQRAVLPDDLSSKATVKQTALSVLNYQRLRAQQELAKDPVFSDVAEHVPRPPFLFAPYFYIDRASWRAWLDVTIALARAAAELGGDDPVHAVICVDDDFLENSSFVDAIVKELPPTGVTGVWLWFSKFAEELAAPPRLLAYRALVEALCAADLEVYSLHGGYFSLALSKLGLCGVSHGVGYGEQKDVVPVIGQSTPTVRYYLPPLHRRLGVPDIQVCFKDLGISTAEDFFSKVCDCVVCKGVIGGDLANFSEFGDMHYSTTQSKRMAQTPASAKRCRYHFLLRRLAERDWIRGATIADVIGMLNASQAAWSAAKRLDRTNVTQLERWAKALA